jgi:hypothetical protein
VALKPFEGFDHFSATADMMACTGFLQWQMPTAHQPTLSFVTAANGIGKRLKITNGEGDQSPVIALRGVFADRNATATLGQRVLIPTGTIGNAAGLYLYLMDTVGGAPQVTIYFNGNNFSVQIFRGSQAGTSLYLSGNNVWTGDVDAFLEFKATIDDSAGSVEVRYKGDVIASVSGVDTKATANAWWDAIDYRPVPVAALQVCFIYLDDVRYNDTATDSGASANNSFMGDTGVRTLFTTGDSAVQFIPNSGANNFSRVNEPAMDSDTTYNSSATPGDEDVFSFQPITNVIVVIYGLQVTIAARKDDVGPRVIKSGVVSGATKDYGANHSVPDTYAYFKDLWVLNPDTGATWTRTGVNAALGLYNLVS